MAMAHSTIAAKPSRRPTTPHASCPGSSPPSTSSTSRTPLTIAIEVRYGYCLCDCPRNSARSEGLDHLCALLHRRIPRRQEITATQRISEEELQHKLDLLLSEGLAKRISQDKLVTTAVVMALDE